jgi:hypothetical protein
VFASRCCVEGEFTAPKNGTYRNVDMSLQLRGVLRLWRRRQRAVWFARGLSLPELVFPSMAHTPLDASNLRKVMLAIVKKRAAVDRLDSGAFGRNPDATDAARAIAASGVKPFVLNGEPPRNRTENPQIKRRRPDIQWCPVVRLQSEDAGKSLRPCPPDHLAVRALGGQFGGHAATYFALVIDNGARLSPRSSTTGTRYPKSWPYVGRSRMLAFVNRCDPRDAPRITDR